MKKIIALLVAVMCLCPVSVFAENTFYISDIEVDFGLGIAESSYQSYYGVTSRSIIESRMYALGAYGCFYKDMDGLNNITTISMIHPAPIDPKETARMLMREPQFEIRDCNGKILMDGRYLVSYAEYQCNEKTIVNEYGELDVSFTPVSSKQRYMMCFAFNAEGEKLLCDITEEIAQRSDGQNYFDVFVNELYVTRYKSKGRLTTPRLWYITEDKNKISQIENNLYAKSNMLLPQKLTIVNANQKVTINCSQWAMNDVLFIYNHGLLDFSDNIDYTAPVTREEFCRYAAGVLHGRPLAVETEYRPMESYISPFSDTASHEVAMLYEYGIIKGKSEKVFAPDAYIKREEAAAIMCRMLECMTGTALRTESEYTFSDDKSFSSWAKEDIYKAYANGIMNGVGNDQFNASGNYTLEQSFATMKRTVIADSKMRYGN